MSQSPQYPDVRALVDNPTPDDRLGRSRLVHAVGSIIRWGRPPLTVAVYGEWGSGKSSFMRRVQAYLDPAVREQLPEKVRIRLESLPVETGDGFVTVYFNLWEHQNDVNPIIAMLEAARDELGRRLSKDWRDRALRLWRDHLSGLLKGALVAMADTTIGLGLQATRAASAGLVGEIGLAGGVNLSGSASVATIQEKVNQAKEARFEVQEQQTRLRQTFDAIIAELVEAQDRARQHSSAPDDLLVQKYGYQIQRRAVSMPRWHTKSGSEESPTDSTGPCDRSTDDSWIRDIRTAPSSCRRKIVFFIDDLDRCPPGLAVDLLEKIRLFLGQQQCVFVIGADEGVIRRAISEERKHLIAGEHGGLEDAGSLYLEKMIQYAIYLPPVSRRGYDTFTEYVLDEVKVRPEVRAAVCSAGGTGLLAEVLEERNATLRQTIRVVNALNVNDFLAKGEIGDAYDPRVTAVLTLIQVLYPLHYQMLREASGTMRGFLLLLLFSRKSSLETRTYDASVSPGEGSAGRVVGHFMKLGDTRLGEHARDVGEAIEMTEELARSYLESTSATAAPFPEKAAPVVSSTYAPSLERSRSLGVHPSYYFMQAEEVLTSERDSLVGSNRLRERADISTPGVDGRVDDFAGADAAPDSKRRPKMKLGFVHDGNPVFSSELELEADEDRDLDPPRFYSVDQWEAMMAHQAARRDACDIVPPSYPPRVVPSEIKLWGNPWLQAYHPDASAAGDD